MTVETKLNLNQETMDALQDLVQINIDSRDGFQHAAEKVDNLTLQSLFQKLASERNQQADELSRLLAINLEEPHRKGSYAAAIHRCWTACREACSSNNAYAVLAEAERGEDQIKAAYENALKQTAGSAVNDVLTRQYAQVKDAHDRVRDLRDESKNETCSS